MTPNSAIAISKIRDMLSKGADGAALASNVAELMRMSLWCGRELAPAQTVHRVTYHHEQVPQTLADIGPPPAPWAGVGRANLPERPVFYGTSEGIAAFYEAGAVSVGKVVVHAKWVTTKPMRVIAVGYSTGALVQVGASRPSPPWLQVWEADQPTASGRDVREFIAMAFTDTTTAHYPLTAAVSALVMQTDDMAVMYPATKKDGNVDNVALATGFAAKALRLEQAMVAKVIDVLPDRSLKTRELGLLRNASGDRLEWDPHGDPMEAHPGDRLSLLAVGQIVQMQSQAGLRVAGKDYQVFPGYQIERTVTGYIIRNLKGEVLNPLV